MNTTSIIVICIIAGTLTIAALARVIADFVLWRDMKINSMYRDTKQTQKENKNAHKN